MIMGMRMMPIAMVNATRALANGRSRSCSTENTTASAAAGDAAAIRITFCPIPETAKIEVNIYAKSNEKPIMIPADNAN